MCKGTPAVPTVHFLWLMLLQAKNWRPSWHGIDQTLTVLSMSAMEVMIIAPSYAFEGTFSGISSDLTDSRTASSQDTVLCRRLKGLERRIETEGPNDGLKCQVYKWTEAWEVEEYFNALWS